MTTVLQESTFVSVLAAAPSWTQSADKWANAAGHRAAYVLLDVSHLSTSGGSIDIALQGCVTDSQLDAAWSTVASVTGVNTTGPQILKVTRYSATPITGFLRLKITRNTADVDLAFRAQLLLKEACQSRLVSWLPDTLLSFSGSGTQTMGADFWQAVAEFTDVWALCEYVSRSGTASNLTINLQTSPSWSAGSAGRWVQTDTGNVGAGALQLDALRSGNPPPLDLMRLEYVAAAALSGTLRVHLLGKG